jgi:hypothetical protein
MSRERVLLGQLARLSPFIIIAAYVVVACIKLRWPAPQYDEAFYVNSALWGGVDQTTFRTATLGPLPFIIMPYIGAVKAYLFMPIFALFGVHAVTMRLPSILITAGALYLLYRLLLARLGRLLALSILLVTALNASFIVFTRLDFGPVVLDFLLKTVALFLLLRFADRPRPKTLIWFWAVMFVGVFNKLNFIWYASAFLAAFAIVWGYKLWRIWSHKERLRYVLISGVGLALCGAYSLYINITYHIHGSLGFVGIKVIRPIIEGVVSGSWFYHYAFSAKPLGWPSAFTALVLIVLLGGMALWLGARHRKAGDETLQVIRPYYAFFLIISLFMVVQLAITKQATAGWHYFSLYPFLGSLLVLSLYAVLHVLLPKRQYVYRGLLVGLLAIFGFYQLTLYRAYIAAYDQPASNITWSPAIYKLIDFTKSHPNDRFVSMSWGTHVQLIAFDHAKGKYSELMGPLQIDDPATSKQIYEQYLAPSTRTYFIAFAGSQAGFPSSRDQLLTLAGRYNYKVTSVTSIGDGHGNEVFDLYTFGKE